MVLNMSISRHLKYGHFRLGFTFAELIIAVSVALIISVLTVLIFVGSTREIGEIRSNSTRDFELAKVYWQIKKQIFSAYESKFSKNVEYVTSEDRKSDYIRFFTASPEVGTGVCEACYYIGKDKNNKKVLYYFENPFPREFDKDNRDLTEKNGHVISEYITGINFSFFKNKKEIEGNISSFGNIDYVYVKLYYTQNNKEQVFEFAVHPGLRR